MLFHLWGVSAEITVTAQLNRQMPAFLARLEEAPGST
jgi:hypothetical protein